jgi:hypothetical protein
MRGFPARNECISIVSLHFDSTGTQRSSRLRDDAMSEHQYSTQPSHEPFDLPGGREFPSKGLIDVPIIHAEFDASDREIQTTTRCTQHRYLSFEKHPLSYFHLEQTVQYCDTLT